MTPQRLGVNVDHVATLRNARGEHYPDPLIAAQTAIAAGADGITIHLREDRRHIREADVMRIRAMIDKPLNFEMAVTDEMRDIALRHRPHAACLVPERREERTTEGGLDVARGHNAIGPVVRALRDAGIRVSLFIEANPVQIAVAEALGAEVVELHTGAYCDAIKDGNAEAAARFLDQLRTGAVEAARRGLEVHAGHGIDFASVGPVSEIPEVVELNIGHFLIGEAIFTGLDGVIAEMRRRMDAARGL